MYKVLTAYPNYHNDPKFSNRQVLANRVDSHQQSQGLHCLPSCWHLLDALVLHIYIFIAIAIDETSILVAIHFSLKNIYQSCDLGRAVGAEQRRHQPITFFVYRRLCDVGHMLP